MTHDSLLAMASVIQACAAHHAEVLSVRQEVIWPDGSKVDLHPIKQHGERATLLRAFHHEGQWLLFDLCPVIPRDIVDIKQAHYRDQVGLVMFALRRMFHNAPAFRVKADRHALAKWPGDARPAGVRPTGTGRAPLVVVEGAKTAATLAARGINVVRA
jgi:hypothetical protein